MQAMIAPKSIVLPFVTIHFMTNPSTDNIKSIDDLPNASWKFVHNKTAEYADLHMRFDLTNFKVNEVEKERGGSLMYEAIINAVNDANFELSDGESGYKNSFYELYAASGTSGAMLGYKSDSTEIINATWSNMCRMIKEKRVGGNTGSFSASTGDNDVKSYSLTLNLGNGYRIFISKNDPKVSRAYYRNDVGGAITLLGDPDYTFNVAGEFWLDAATRNLLKFVPLTDIAERTIKVLYQLFDGLLDKENISDVLMDMKFDK